MKSFSGIFPALLTPFAKDGSVNYDSLNKLVDMNLNKGVRGFYVCGSTAEAFMLPDDTRKQILEKVIDRNAGRGTVIAHIGTISQSRAIEMAKHAQKAGADAISSIPPFYYGFNFDCIRDYYFALADAVDIPVIIYNFPANSGVKLTLENVKEFLKDKRFLGVKHTSSDFYMLQQMKADYPDRVFFNGYDEMFLSGLAAGADGGIGSTYNFMAEKFIAIRELFLKGEIARAQSIQNEANRILNVLIRLGVMPAEKAALDMMGIEMGDCQKPFPTLNDAQKAELRSVLIENGIQL